MRFRIDLAASVPKDATSPELNEDAWSHDESKTCLALSDGASESFDSRSWARLLVRKFVDDQCITPEWANSAIHAYSKSVDVDSLGWAALRAFDRGSFATLLGITMADNETDVGVLCVGDSLAMLVRRGVVLDTYPFTKPEHFDARPTLISTKPGTNTFLTKPSFFGTSSKTWAVLPGDVIYAVTDAVGHWLLTQAFGNKDFLETFGHLNSEDDFAVLVHNLRAERKIRLDDSTMIRLVVESLEP